MTPSEFERNHAQRMQDYGAAMAANVAKVQTLADLAYLIIAIFNDLDTMAEELPTDRNRRTSTPSWHGWGMPRGSATPS